MDINTKNRVELKNFFKKNAIPTESNFADLIDAGVNQKEDGLYKPAGEALSLEASLADPKTAISFYETFTGNPSWAVSLYEPTAQQAAFVVSDSAGSTRLWIGAQDGVVHVGSPTTPGALTVGTLTATGAVTAGSITTSGAVSTGALTVTGLTSTGAISASGGLTVPAGKTLTVSGMLAAGTTTTGALTASGAITANAGLTVPSGQTLTVSGTLAASTTTTGALAASGAITASGGLTVPSGQTLTVSGTLAAGTTTTGALTAAGALNANGGITIPNPYGLYVGGTITAGGAITTSGLITANGGLTVNGTLTTDNIDALGGITVPAGKAVTVSSAINMAPSSRTGYRFDKSSIQYATLPGTSINFSGGITIQTWIYMHSMDSGARIIDFMNGSNYDDAIALMIDSNGTFALRTTATGGGATITPSPSNALTTNVWTHVAMSIGSGGIVKLYKNGVQIASGTNVLPGNVTRNANRIGYSWYATPSTRLNAVLSDLSVWTGAQTPSLTAPASNAAGLVGHWKFYGATPTADACTNASRIGDATLVNGPSSAPGFGLTWDESRSAVTIDQAIIGQASVAQEFWTTATLVNAWILYSTNYNAPGFFKDSMGMVHLRGVVSSGSSGSVVFTLPSNYRPEHTERHPVAASTSGCYADINTGGNVIIYLSGATTWVSLDGIRFRQYY